MGSEKLIANELLAFIQHAIDTMDEVSIMQICKSNFKVEEICKSKVLLYETLGQAERMPTRRRDEKGEKSLQDIINLLKATDPDDVPAFVAQQLQKLPPVTFDHVDVTRLLKDINALKAGLAEVQLKLEISESTVDCVKLNMKICTRNFRTQSSDVSNLDTDAEFHEDAEAAGNADKSDSASQSSNSVIERPEQMKRDTQRELSISPIWKTKGTKRVSTVFNPVESDEEETPFEKPCDNRMSVAPEFSSDDDLLNNTETGADAEDIIWKRLTAEVYSDPSTPSGMLSDDELDSDSDVESISGRAVYPASQDYWASDDELDNEGDTSEISTQDDNIRKSLFTISEANEYTTGLSLSQPQSPTPIFNLELPLFTSPGATRPGLGDAICSAISSDDDDVDDDEQGKSQCDLRIPSHSAPEIDTPESYDDAIVATSSGYPSEHTVTEKKRRVDDVVTQVEVHRPSVSEDIQTTASSRHVSIQTDPPADPDSTLPSATTLVFGTSRAVPCLVLVSSADPSILDKK